MVSLVLANCRRTTPILGSVAWGKVRWAGDLKDVRGKRVLLFVHGIRETEARLGAVYSEMLSRAVASHDVGVGFIWPGGSTVPATWIVTTSTALVPCGQRLRDVILEVAKREPASIDINAHSLGAAVVASAMRQAGAPYRHIRHVYLMAPAIGQSDLAEISAVTGRVHVCFNHYDPALMAYRLWPPRNWFENAVGLVGPDGGHRPNVVGHDYSGLIGHTHGGYRRESLYYQTMLEDGL